MMENPEQQYLESPAAAASINADPDLVTELDFLRPLKDPLLDPLFWRAERIGAPSAWWQHVPFAHWIVRVAAPRVLVELGTHTGVSYSAFCGAVARERLATRCHAVDTWRGDKHSGEYGEGVFEDFRRYHDERFADFSTLMRCTFDEAIGQIEDSSIDLLHIDGLHTYEGVSHDFTSWMPKLSNRAIVLFHDTNERKGNFGVWRFWSELRERYDSFEFLHGHGLGVLSVGVNAPPILASLCSLGDEAAIATIRQRFARIGERWLYESRENSLRLEIEQRAAAASAVLLDRLSRAEADVTSMRGSLERAETEVTTAMAELVAARAQIESVSDAQKVMRAQMAGRSVAARADAEAARARAVQAEATSALLRDHLARAVEDLSRCASKRDAMRASASWRLTRPMRAVGRLTSKKLRRAVSNLGKIVWWSLTLRLVRKLRKQERRRLEKKLAERVNANARVGRGAPRPNDSSKHNSAVAAANVHTAAQRIGTSSYALHLVYISGEPDTPGHLYRVARSAAAATALGARATPLRIHEISARLTEIESADILWIWRAPWSESLAAAVDAARYAGARIVFDVDDLMVDPDFARTDVIDGIRSQSLSEDSVVEHFARLRVTMAAADLCIAPTEELAAHMRRAWMPSIVLENGFDHATLATSRLALGRRRLAHHRDGLIRIGYASGSRTHQRDFAECAEALASVLRAHPECRLVAFRDPTDLKPVLNIDEFGALRGLDEQIEWRNLVPLGGLPEELARFDINLAPLEFGNPFCEAKSELKYFEAALVKVPTIASPTGPYRRAIRHGETGFLAASTSEWHEALTQLVDDPGLRRRLAAAARREVLWRYGPESRTEQMALLIDLVTGARDAARAFELRLLRSQLPPAKQAHIPYHQTIFESYQLELGSPDVTIVIPLYNYAQYITEALESVKAQTENDIDLIIVDDRSTDDSLSVAVEWAKRNVGRFNRISVLQNEQNSGLAFSRNVGFESADTPFVLPLDADNRLLPKCVANCLKSARATSASFLYPVIRQFGVAHDLMGEAGYNPLRLANANYIDAMALVSKAAWSAVGGYDHIPGGWEDFDFWCRLAERGLRGEQVRGEPLAEYRVHENSMIHSAKANPDVIRRMMNDLSNRHPWLTLVWPLPVPEEDGKVQTAAPPG